jgi:hypothetical protein
LYSPTIPSFPFRMPYTPTYYPNINYIPPKFYIMIDTALLHSMGQCEYILGCQKLMVKLM